LVGTGMAPARDARCTVAERREPVGLVTCGVRGGCSPCRLKKMESSRTGKIEELAARFCAAPLTAEIVFLCPAYQHGRFEREVCDLLVAFQQRGIVLSLKSGRARREGSPPARPRAPASRHRSA
jgi:hypothetical protein